MLSKLPKWLEFGAFVLAAIAGFVNAVGLLGFEHQAVSHLSGTATLVGVGLLRTSLAEVLHLAGIIVMFLCGAAVSGLLLQGEKLKLGRAYDLALVLEATLLVLAMHLLTGDNNYGHYAASAACGLQNALATTYSNTVVRTTHITGIVTDLGLMLGARLRGQALDRRRALLFLLIISGFIAGGSVGAWSFLHLHFTALAMPAALCVVLAIGYRAFVKRVTPIASEH